MQKYVGLYGNVKLLRMYCKQCKRMAIVLDDKFQCCDRKILDEDKEEYYAVKRMSGTSYERRKPSKKRINRLLDIQSGKCLYCEIPFETYYQHPKSKKMQRTTICCDHYVPFAYSQNNKDENFVLACGICNGIKSSKLFKTLEDAKEYVTKRRQDKGFKPEIYIL